MTDKAPRRYAGDPRTDQAWRAGYAHGKTQCNHHPEAMTNEAVNSIIANERRKNSGYSAGKKEGRAEAEIDHAKARKVIEKHANQWLMEAFILFMQEQGAEAAAMTLDQMHGLREAVNEVSDRLAIIEEPR